MRIYLVGFMGAGKTTVGEGLAERLGCAFLDLDHEIERRRRMTVTEIFASEGEPAFRDLESSALRATAGTADLVVATGGGVLSREANRRFLRDHGLTVWLHPDLDVLLARGRGAPNSQRPLFGDEGNVRDLYRRREEHYRGADLEIRVADEETASTTIERVLQRIEEQRCAT